ncbi:MAG TPA: hypothetical protein VMY42_25480 [Thermoguttaceae bacterium]|nr:hypothetical protein [Thermoguttaceae bacterium]
MWKFERDADYEKRVKRWPKKHRRELKAMHDNLDTFVGALNRGAMPAHEHFGFIHDEPKGIKAIDQKGAGAGVKQCRLYIFPDTTTKIVHLITIGDKSSQKADIQYACQFVDSLITREGDTNG